MNRPGLPHQRIGRPAWSGVCSGGLGCYRLAYQQVKRHFGRARVGIGSIERFWDGGAMVRRELLSANDVALVIGVTPRAVRRMLVDGRLHGYRLGRRWYVPRRWLSDTLGFEV